MRSKVARSGTQPLSVDAAGATALSFRGSTSTVQRSAKISSGRPVQCARATGAGCPPRRATLSRARRLAHRDIAQGKTVVTNPFVRAEIRPRERPTRLSTGASHHGSAASSAIMAATRQAAMIGRRDRIAQKNCRCRPGQATSSFEF